MRVPAALTVGALLLSTGVRRAEAAHPPRDSVWDARTSVSYRGGPFFVSRPTGAREAVCSPATCDDFVLEVAFSADYVTTHPGESITVSLEWPTASNDFDLYVLDANGQELTRSATTAVPEVARVPLSAGPYRLTVRVVPIKVRGESFTTNISVSAAPARPPEASPLGGPEVHR